MEWPSGLRCDLVDVPLESCCGVIAQLEGLGVRPCPVAQVGDRLLFLVAEGSAPAVNPDLDGLPPGFVTHQSVDHLPGLDGGDGDRCWVIPTPSGAGHLPLAGVLVDAVRSAYAEYQAVRAVSA